jgi:hypothetical protein
MTTTKISTALYVRAWRNAKRNPDGEFKFSLFTGKPATGAEIRQGFINQLHEQINERRTK